MDAQRRGRLKIFFGYAPGTGKTYAMLQAAHAAAERGIDTVVGWIDPHVGPETAERMKGLEQLPRRAVESGGLLTYEFDLDAAISRAPQLILVDELAHANAEGLRHHKRYQDVEELLRAGIDVYSTANVQDIESLNDRVAPIAGAQVRERVPDSVFDGAEQVELIDAEPQELMERNAACQQQEGEGSGLGLFTAANLTALREIALRRCADRVNLRAENARAQASAELRTDEHILVCLSSAPSNAKIIRTAARMAAAFRGAFTALFVETPDFSAMSGENRERLRNNVRLAQQLGAQIETVCGDDIPFQIAEFARLNGVTKIVIGRTTAARKWPLGKPGLTDRLIANAPNLDVHIIPDGAESSAYRPEKAPGRKPAPSLRDLGVSLAVLLLATLVGFAFSGLGFTEANIITVYILGVLVISILTASWICGLFASAVSVLVFNFFFTAPQFTFEAYGSGYPVTFAVMFLAAFLMGTLAGRLKDSARQSAQSAYRTKVLLDTNRLLRAAQDRNGILSATAGQLVKLLGRDVTAYPAEDGEPGEPLYVSAADGERDESCLSPEEKEVAAWVMKNNKHAGATTDTLSDARCLYLAIRAGGRVYGVVGIKIGSRPPDVFENSVLLSILGECALALENEKNSREKEEAAVLAKNEQLRANLLRAISHDLRTPLTSISGNASNLLTNGESFDEESRRQICSDIYEDSLWLINLVENLLSVTRMEESRVKLNLTNELMDEVIAEALRHVSRKSAEHTITVESAEDFIFVHADPKLIVQVVINIVDNAIKYTPAGSHIVLRTERDGGRVIVRISDDGPGIPDDAKPRIFDMFYTGKNQVADSRRSLGLGLALCRSIIRAHGGEISVADNPPHGTVFTFTLDAGEVSIHE